MSLRHRSLRSPSPPDQEEDARPRGARIGLGRRRLMPGGSAAEANPRAARRWRGLSCFHDSACLLLGSPRAILSSGKCTSASTRPVAASASVARSRKPNRGGGPMGGCHDSCLSMHGSISSVLCITRRPFQRRTSKAGSGCWERAVLAQWRGRSIVRAESSIGVAARTRSPPARSTVARALAQPVREEPAVATARILECWAGLRGVRSRRVRGGIQVSLDAGSAVWIQDLRI